MTRRLKKAHNHTHQDKGRISPYMWAALGAVIVVILGAVIFLRRDDEEATEDFEPDPNFTPQVEGAPRLEVVSEEVLNFGDVEFEEPVNATFRIRNIGDEPLKIEREPHVELIEGC